MNKALPSNGLNRTEFVRSQYTVIVKAGTQPEDVLKPSYWAHHSKDLRERDLIEILAEDNSFEMTVRVLRTGIQFAKVRELSRHVFGEISKVAEPAEQEKKSDLKLDDITVTWGGPAHKWRVLNGNNLVSKGHKTKEDAEEYAKSYHKEISEAA